MSNASPVFLVDVDSTLLDNDRIQDDVKRHMEQKLGVRLGEEYWAIQKEIFERNGYRDYLEALQRLRCRHPYEPNLLTAANYILEYPFANRLYPGALDVLERFRQRGRTVILTDGEVVFQPLKVQRSGIFEAVEGHVLIYAHKEEALENIEQRYPAEHYVLVDDKLRILTAFKKAWGGRVTTVFPRQGRIALDPKVTTSYPAADISVERISDLLCFDLQALLPDSQLKSFV